MMTTPDYLFVGHITADITPNGRVLGGTPSYGAFTVASFGLNIGILTSAAVDEPLLEQLRAISDVVSKGATDTTTFENIYEPSGRKQFVRGVAAPISPADVPEAWKAAPLVHLSPMADEVDPTVAHEFKHSTVLLTLQGWLRRWDADGLVRFKRWYEPDVLKSIDIVVFSEEDILEAPELEAEFAQGVKHLFVTRAEKGGTYYHNGVPHEYTTPQVDLVHPTGAGDVFAASLLASLPRVSNDLLKATQVAAHLASLSVTRFGLASAPTVEEVQTALARVNASH
jgi:sugar/nucleoside kinase (ribokinase family)